MFPYDEIDIKVNYHGLPYRLHMTDNGDWCDLFCAETVYLTKGSFALISQGISMQLPDGYEAILAPRSSTFKKYGLLQANSIGIIDNSYCGDDDIWCFAAYATRDVEIQKGTRICQFRIQEKQPHLHFISVPSLGTENRGGFGSTGD